MHKYIHRFIHTYTFIHSASLHICVHTFMHPYIHMHTYIHTSFQKLCRFVRLSSLASLLLDALCYSWEKMQRRGRSAKTQEQLDREMFRKCVYLVERHRNLWLQHVMHTHIICYKDESFIHAMRNGQCSLLPRDKSGKVMQALHFGTFEDSAP